MNETDIYSELGVLTKDKNRWKENIFNSNPKDAPPHSMCVKRGFHFFASWVP